MFLVGTSQEAVAINLGILEKDTVVYLSITDSVREINEKISSIPHNLNTHNLAFIFVVPTNYNSENETLVDDQTLEDSQYYEYFMDIGNQNILFNGFFNGTLFIFGDFLHDTYTLNSKGEQIKNFTALDARGNFINRKTKEQISDPVKYDNINPSLYINRLYKEIDNPESIVDMINYEGKEDVVHHGNLNKIKIKGTGLNSKYSLLTLSDVTAKTYIKNLSFESTLKAKDNVIDITNQLNSNLPTADKLFLQYPFFENAAPIIGDAFIDYLQTMSNEPFFNKMTSYMKTINNALTNLYNVMMNDSFIVRDEDFINFEVDDDFVTILRDQIDDLRELPGVTDSWLEIELDDPEYSILSTSVFSELKKFVVGDDVDEDLLTQNDIKILTKSFESAYNIIDIIKQSAPSGEYSDFKDGTGLFRSDEYISIIKNYINHIKDFKMELSGAFGKPAFSIFLSLRPDLVSDEYDTYTNDIAYQTFLNNYKIPVFFESLDYALSSIQLNVIEPITFANFDNLSSDFTFQQEGLGVKYSHVEILNNSSDNFLETNYSDGSCDTLDLSYDNLTGKYGKMILSNQYTSYVARLLFESNKWPEITQKYTQSLAEYIPMFDSQYDSTLVFWTKYKNSTDVDQIVYLSFMVGQNEFKFSIKPHSYASIDKSTNTGGTNDTNGNLSSSDLSDNKVIDEEDKARDRNAWTMWTIKFDNTSRYLEKFNGQPGNPDFKNKIGLNVTSYTFKEDLTGRSYYGYEIVKHNMNEYVMDETTETLQGTEGKYLKNYVWEPFIGDPSRDHDSQISEETYEAQFNNFTINIGYSKEPVGDTENTYYYNGYFRNLTLFKGHLTSLEEEALFRLGILNNYEWPTEYETDELKKLIQSGRFFFGLVSVYDSSNINIINCNTKYNGNTYLI